MHAAVVISAFVPLRHASGIALRQFKRNMIADQLPSRRTILSRRALQPVQRGGKTLRQAAAAEQVQLAQRELGCRLTGTGIADDRQFFAVSHRWIT